MTRLSFPEFLSRREAFDAAVAAQDEIAGLHEWESEWGYAGSSGSPKKSPWE
jgi:hypothetical protein